MSLFYTMEYKSTTADPDLFRLIKFTIILQGNSIEKKRGLNYNHQS